MFIARTVPHWCSAKGGMDTEFFKNKQYFLRKALVRDPWVAQRFGACLWPRA